MRVEESYIENTQGINSYKGEKLAQKFTSMMRFIILIGILVLAITIIYLYISKSKKEDSKAVTVNPYDDSRIYHPYVDIPDFFHSANKCNKIAENPIDIAMLSTSGTINMIKTEKLWSMINVTLLFTYLEGIVASELQNGITSYCSTMIGIHNVPCACVLHLSNNETLWVLDVHNKNILELGNASTTQYAYIKEKPYIFKNMHDGYIEKKIPIDAQLSVTLCSKKMEGLSCKKSTKFYEGEDVFNWNRLIYFMDFDPQTYNIYDPYFGHFIDN